MKTRRITRNKRLRGKYRKKYLGGDNVYNYNTSKNMDIIKNNTKNNTKNTFNNMNNINGLEYNLPEDKYKNVTPYNINIAHNSLNNRPIIYAYNSNISQQQQGQQQQQQQEQQQYNQLNNIRNNTKNNTRNNIKNKNTLKNKCFNPIMYNYENITQNSTIFYVINTKGKIQNVSCLDEEGLNYYKQLPEYLYQPCKSNNSNKKPLRRLDFGSNVYVLDKELQQVKVNGSYILIPTLNDVGRIILETSLQNQSMLSVNPCQTEIKKPIYKIYILDDKAPSETLLYRVGDKVRHIFKTTANINSLNTLSIQPSYNQQPQQQSSYAEQLQQLQQLQGGK